MDVTDPAAAYGLFTGRYSERLAHEFAAFVDPAPGQRVLDVGCGPGALTEVLVTSLGVAEVAACVCDNAGGRGPLSPLWRAAHDLDPAVRHESGLAGAREGHLAELAEEAGLARVGSSRLTVEVPFASFEEWWEPLAMGVGSGGAYVKGLEEPYRQALRGRLEGVLGPAPFAMSATAWCVRAEVAD